MSLIPDTIQNYLPIKRKKTPSGWWVFNAVCCQHNGHSKDTRQRGGFIVNEGNASTYHCFNCQFKTSWYPGKPLSNKFKNLMRWLGINDDTINKLSMEAIKLLNEHPNNSVVNSIVPSFIPTNLPIQSEPISNYINNNNIPPDLIPILDYIYNSRNLTLNDYNFYWTPVKGFNTKLIIPFYYNNTIVGYTARETNTSSKQRYISDQQPGFVFNLDNQHNNYQSVLVVEGPLDAISINGCAILGANIKNTQDYLLKQLNKEIILIPDKDHEGPSTIKQAIDLGWSVSLPIWPENYPIKDVNDSVKYIGKLATLWLIHKYKLSNPLKIQLHAKKWF